MSITTTGDQTPPERPEINAATIGDASPDPAEMRIAAVMAAARHHGYDLDRASFRVPAAEGTPSPASLAEWVRGQGLWAKGVRLTWRQLFRFQTGAPVVLLFNDGTAGLLVGSNIDKNIVWLKDPRDPDGNPTVVDELRLRQLWLGEALLVRLNRGESLDDAPFTLGWIARLVLREKKLLRDISFVSIFISALTIIPPFIVMVVIDKVITFNAMDTLLTIAAVFTVMIVWETILTYAQREMVNVIGARIDGHLNLHVFRRMLILPLDFFERNQAGGITQRLMKVFEIRNFLTQKLLVTALDLMTIVFILPLLFYLEATLAWIALILSVLIALVIMVFLPAVRRRYARYVNAEIQKGSVLVETLHGMRTVKSLALESSRRTEWDHRVAESADAKLSAARLSNWPQTITIPIERIIQRGLVLLGAYLILFNPSAAPASVGGLIAFMLLGGRMAQPLIGAARLLEDMEEARAAVHHVAGVLNNPTEGRAMTQGLRPRFDGAISFEELTYSYPGSKTPALNKVSFSIPPGTMLGVVGKSGSGKSTLTRLLQGISRDYSGYLKLDGSELREINLTHLRRSFGVVLQDNFLFRGTVRENILANRPGLTLEDAVQAARLAGAEEFIERLPKGYETWIEEGSANLSGGQRQRLAIARALVSDPRIMILDEATSALDPESEALVNANLMRIGSGRTMVIVSHRLSSLVDCDLTLVMDRGAMVDIAPHKVLLDRCDIYRQLWLQQNRHLDGGGVKRSTGITPVLAEGD